MSTASGGSRSGSSSHAAYRCASRWFTPTYGQVGDERERLRRAHADEQRAGEPGTVARRDRVERRGARAPASPSASAITAVDELDVRPARDLGHDATEAGVQVDLARRRPTTGRAARRRRRRPRSRRTTSRSRGRAHRLHQRSGSLDDGLAAARSPLDAGRAARRTRRCRSRAPTSRARPRSSPVVVLAHADRPEAEAPVQVLRALVREPHLEREVLRVPRERLAREREHEARADAGDAASAGSTAIVVTCPSSTLIIRPA